MNKTRHYKVAGHYFSLSLPDSEKLWNTLETAYGPFLVDEKEASSHTCLFSLEYADSIEDKDGRCVYDEPTEDGETMVRMFELNDGWLFETAYDSKHDICCRTRTDRGFSKAVFSLASRSLRDAVFAINNSAMLMFAFASAKHHTLEFHASVIENGGKAFLFLGKSGTGKSTHSNLWLKHIDGSTLMNDDNPVVRVWTDRGVIVYGSPWSGKTPCYKNIEAPAGAFVQIRQCPENKIRKMSVLEGYSSLFSSISGIKDDANEMADSLNNSLSDLLTAVPCWLLDCRPDEEAARLCAETMRNNKIL